jgi:hypothetical protein
MAPANVMTLVPDPSATTIRATIDALLNTRRAIERAEGDLGRDREKKVAERIDLFCAAASKGDVVAPADALKTQLELETLKKLFDDQEKALDVWETAVNDRLTNLAVEYWAEVLEALDTQIAALKLQESKEQGDVDEVKSVILEFDHLRTELQHKRHPPSGSGTKKITSSKGEHS